MTIINVPAYLKDLRFKVEDIAGKEQRIVRATLFIEPFTENHAAMMGVDDELFTQANTPVDMIERVELKLGTGKNTYVVEIHPSNNKSTDATFRTEEAYLGPILKVRRNKESPVFAASFTFNCLYPPAKDLLSLASAVNKQYWIWAEPATKSLFAESNSDKPAKKDRKKPADGATAPPPS